MRLLLTTAILTTLAVPSYADMSLRDRAGTISRVEVHNIPSAVYKPSSIVQEFSSLVPSAPSSYKTRPEPVQNLEKKFPSKNIQTYKPINNSNAVSMPSREVGKSNLSQQNLQPRVELNHRYSNDRAITMSEFWVPLAQNTAEGSVLFGDVRLMGDNNNNKEFNIGVGYRDITDTKLFGEGILGGMVWFDRRETTNESKFNQVTVGGEWLKEDWDVRANAYVPLNDSETFTRANPNGAGAGFVGNQLLVNTDQVLVEEALTGGDVEVGYRLPFMDDLTDVTRIYAGGYHFVGDRAEDVTGWRTRFTSDITNDIQIGARYQYDDERGSQTYFEATVRFPFGHKKSFKEEGLRSRLDESPERDIDIVSNEAVIDEGLTNTTLLNAQTGMAQNIIHVNNTNGAGTGTAIDPFNTLAAAEGAAGANDMIYVQRGDGTATGQNNGITLDDTGQMLTGSGADLMFSRDRFKTSNGLDISQPMIQASAAPVLTNGAGNGVLVTADNIYLSGITVDGASNNNIQISNAGSVVIEKVNLTQAGNNNLRTDYTASNTFNLSITDSELTFGQFHNAYFVVRNDAKANISISDSLFANPVSTSGGSGYSIRLGTRENAETSLSIKNNTILNSRQGIGAVTGDNSTSTLLISGNVLKNSRSFITSNDDGILSATLSGNTFENESGNGLAVQLDDNGRYDNLILENNIFNNTKSALEFDDKSANNIGSISFSNNSFNNNDTHISVDLDGERLNAQRNWWGTPAGLASNKVELIDSSLINSSSPLFSDPN